MLSMRHALRITALMVFAGTICGCATVPRDTAPQPARAMRDFRTTVSNLIGKPMDQVVAAVGRPDRQYGGDRQEWWVYENRFRDSVTGRELPVVTFFFRDRQLDSISF